jgi:hypothetical protein
MAIKQKDASYKSLNWLGLTVQILIGIVLVMALVRLGGFVVDGYLLSIGRTTADLEITSTIEKTAGMLGSLFYLWAGVFFLAWQRRAFRNLGALNAEGMKNKEWYCLWSFFVPVACLYTPMSVMNETWKASNPAVLDKEEWKNAKNSVLIICWWAAWLAYGLPNLFRTLFAQGTYDESSAMNFLQSMPFFMILQAIYCIAAFLAILVVRQVTARQTKKYELIQSHKTENIN